MKSDFFREYLHRGIFLKSVIMKMTKIKIHSYFYNFLIIRADNRTVYNKRS